MADKIIGITLNGVNYDYEDETASQAASAIAESIGDLSALETEEKTSIVGAINELTAGGSGHKEDTLLEKPGATTGPGLEIYSATLIATSEGLLYGKVQLEARFTPTLGDVKPSSIRIAHDSSELCERLVALWGEGIIPASNTRYLSAEFPTALFVGEPGVETLQAGSVSVSLQISANRTASMTLSTTFRTAAILSSGTYQGSDHGISFVMARPM